jgi:hypothetical protein
MKIYLLIGVILTAILYFTFLKEFVNKRKRIAAVLFLFIIAVIWPAYPLAFIEALTIRTKIIATIVAILFGCMYNYMWYGRFTPFPPSLEKEEEF